MPYRVVFMGTPDFAVPALRALADDPDFDIVLVVSQPDRPQGRKQILLPTPVHATAAGYGLPVIQPEAVRTDEFLQQIQDASPDFLVTAAYGRILPEPVLQTARLAAVNCHASLLPRYRGASPVHWSIINGDREAGVTFMEMVAAMDAGGIYDQVRTPIGPEETAGELMDRLAGLAGEHLPKALRQIAAGNKPVPQDEAQVSYVGMLSRDTGLIDWSKPAQAVHDLVRGTQPWPGASTSLGEKKVKIHRSRVVGLDDLPPTLASNAPKFTEAAPGTVVFNKRRLLVACGPVEGQPSILEILELQMPGGKALSAVDCAHNFKSGTRFGE